jgi:hypothetical protein
VLLQSFVVELDGLTEGWPRKLLCASFVLVETEVEARNQHGLASPQPGSRSREV